MSTSPSIEPSLDILWSALRNQQAHPAPPTRAPIEHRLLTLSQTRLHLHRQLAIQWLRKHPKPHSRADLARMAAADEDWVKILGYAQQYLPALDRMREPEFQWRDMHIGPLPGQPVLYFFDVVGTFPGIYAGSAGSGPSLSTPHGVINTLGVSTFLCLFGGQLDDSVSRWMPMPGVPFGMELAHP